MTEPTAIANLQVPCMPIAQQLTCLYLVKNSGVAAAVHAVESVVVRPLPARICALMAPDHQREALLAYELLQARCNMLLRPGMVGLTFARSAT
jgi:hypothetical protein